MAEKIIDMLRAVPPTLLPLVPMPFVAVAAFSLWFVVNLAVHSLGGSIS